MEVEHQLIDRLRAGDAGAVSDLAARYGAKIYQLAFRYVKTREDAEEVAQDVLLKVYQNIRAFRGDAALSSWIYRITFNTAMSRWRADRLEASTHSCGTHRAEDPDSGSPLQMEVADWSSLADHQVLRAEMREKLVAALKDLPVAYRVAVLLRDVRGLSTEDAAAVLGINLQTLKSRLHRGRLILRERLSEFADGLSLRRP